MLEPELIERLREAVRQDGRSMRQISIACGLGPSFVSGIVNEGKDPSFTNLMRLCRELRLEPNLGPQSPPTLATVLAALATLPESELDAVRDFLNATRPKK